jgi:lysophospholipase
LSRDPEVVAAYRADPYTNHKRIRLQIINAMVKASQEARAQLHTIRLPVLILHGTDDKAAPIAGSRYLYEHISSPDKTLKLYEGLYHEIHNEPEQERVLNDLVTWLDRQQQGDA